MRIETRGTEELVGDLMSDVGELVRGTNFEVQRLDKADYSGVVLRGVGQLIDEARTVADTTLNSAGDLVDLAANHLPGVTRSH